MAPHPLRPALALAFGLALSACATTSSTSSEPTPMTTTRQSLEGIDWAWVDAEVAKRLSPLAVES